MSWDRGCVLNWANPPSLNMIKHVYTVNILILLSPCMSFVKFMKINLACFEC